MASGIAPLNYLAGQVVPSIPNALLDLQRFTKQNTHSTYEQYTLLSSWNTRCFTTCFTPFWEWFSTQLGRRSFFIATPLVVFPTWPTRRWCPGPTFGLERFLLWSSQVASDPWNFFFFVLSFFAVPLFRGVHFYFSHRLVQVCHPTELPDSAKTGTLIQNLSTSISTLWPPLGISKTGIWFKTT